MPATVDELTSLSSVYRAHARREAGCIVGTIMLEFRYQQQRSELTLDKSTSQKSRMLASQPYGDEQEQLDCVQEISWRENVALNMATV